MHTMADTAEMLILDPSPHHKAARHRQDSGSGIVFSLFLLSHLPHPHFADQLKLG
jgi:hypothetical protein